MSRSFFSTFGGDECVIVIDRDYGYEPDTNAHDVDWHVEPVEEGKKLPQELPSDEQRLWQEVYSFLEDCYDE